jgi:DNA-binding transcriptional regulator WhiA
MSETIKNSKIRQPRMSCELAEFIGIHYGDGSLYKVKSNYILTYCFNLTEDIDFSNYFYSLFQKLFNIKLHIYCRKNRNSIEFFIRSKRLYNFFKNHLKLPVGKKENLRIPTYIRKNKKFLSSFLQGLFDTDGCVTYQKFGKYSYKLVKICTKCKLFALDIKRSLIKLDVPCFICTKTGIRKGKFCTGYDIVVRNNNINAFIKKIGSKNKRNILKLNKKSGDAGI